MGKILLFLLLLSGPLSVIAQSYDKEFQTVFVWEVKQIDEFIERFNDSDKTLIKEYYKKIDTSTAFTRERLIKGLFNAEGKNWNFGEITTFIGQVTDPQHPQYLDFFGGNWNATVKCAVAYKGKQKVIIFTMALQKMPNGSSKWVITGADAPFLRVPAIQKHLIKIPDSRDTAISLNPVSNATDFLNIDKVSKDKANLKNYFLQAESYNNDIPLVENEILNGHLIINKTVTVIYNFRQVPGWEMEIEQFNRQTRNSGWLISKLTKLQENQ